MKIFRILLTLSYLFCIGLLVVESALPGDISAGQSNAVGGTIADIINQNKGDQYEEVKPTSILWNDSVKDTMFVSHQQTLSYTIEPKDCTYQSVSFQTDRPDILEVSASGVITAKKSGDAIITVSVQGFEKVSAEKTIHVEDIHATKIHATILNAKKNEEIYSLTAGSSYPIETTFTPADTTDQTLQYTCEEENYQNYFSMSASGLIIAKKASGSKTFTISVSTKNNIHSSLKVQILSNETNVVPLTSMHWNDNTAVSLTLYSTVNTTLADKFQILYEPLNATYKTYHIQSDNPEIVKVSGTKIRGLKEGTTTLTFLSDYDANIKIQKEVNVVCKDLVSFLVKVNQSKSPILIQNQDYPIQFVDTSTEPSSLLLQDKSQYTSDLKINGQPFDGHYEDSYITIDSDLTLHCLTPIENYTLTFSLPTREGSEDRIQASIILKIHDTHTENFLFHNNLGISIDSPVADCYIQDFESTYDLKQKLTLVYKEDMTELTMTFTLDIASEFDGLVTLENDKLSFDADKIAKMFTFSLICNYNSIFEKTITVLCAGRFAFAPDTKKNDAVSLSASDYRLYVDEVASFTIIGNSNDSYVFEVGGDNDAYTILKNDGKDFSIRSTDEGMITVTAFPLYQDVKLSFLSSSISIAMEHRYAIGFQMQYLDATTNDPLVKANDGYYHIYFQTVVTPVCKFSDVTPTLYNLEYQLDHESTFSNGSFHFNAVGTTNVTAVETITGLKQKDTFIVEYKTEFDEKKPFEILQEKGSVSYDEEEKLFTIENGISGKFKVNFTKDSTYQKVTYETGDPKIANIGQDGIITPVKVGKTTLTAKIDNGFNFSRTITVNLEVKPQNFIRDMGDFFFKIRKGIGHFGAFLVFAICSLMFYTINVKRKYWFYSIPFAFLQGLGVAALTEFTQFFTPGRSGLMSDVILDFFGFSVGGVFTMIIIISVVFIPYFIRRRKEKQKK